MVQFGNMNVQDNWNRVQETIARHARGAVTIVAVTKGRPAEDVRAVVAAGATVLGENRVEEVIAKYQTGGLRTELPGIQIHMIGHLQTRKVRDAVTLFDCIQSVDSAKLAREIEKRCGDAGRATMDVLIEVNVSGEEQKYGVRPADAEELVREVIALPHLKLRGLMTMAPYTEDESVVRAAFSGLRVLAERLGTLFGPERFTVLSMGMSHDYTLACEEGSTMVRIGTALFA